MIILSLDAFLIRKFNATFNYFDFKFLIEAI